MGKRMGRPPKPPKPGQMAPLSVRITAKLKQALQDEADYFGRSISAEVEHRLEQSFDRAMVEEEVIKNVIGLLIEMEESTGEKGLADRWLKSVADRNRK